MWAGPNKFNGHYRFLGGEARVAHNELKNPTEPRTEPKKMVWDEPALK